MYDEVIKKVPLTADEVSIIRELLEERQDYCVSKGEVLTIEMLLEKIEN